jgi:hypothetical protein
MESPFSFRRFAELAKRLTNSTERKTSKECESVAAEDPRFVAFVDAAVLRRRDEIESRNLRGWARHVLMQWSASSDPLDEPVVELGVDRKTA